MRPRHRAIRAGLLCGAALAISVGAGVGATVLPGALAQASETSIDAPTYQADGTDDASDGVVVTLDDTASDEITTGKDVTVKPLSGEVRTGRDTKEEALEQVADAVDADNVNVTMMYEADGEVTAVLEPTDGKSDMELLQELENTDGIKDVIPNYSLEFFERDEEPESYNVAPLATSVNDPVTTNKTYNYNESPTKSDVNQYYLDVVGADDAWDKGYTTDGEKIVAVVDSGCDLDAEDLQSNLMKDLAWDIGEVSGQYYVGHSLSETKTKFGTYDYNEHGTHVAGIVAADANNGKVMAGVSHNAKLLPIKISSYSLENGQIKEDLNIETVAGGINYLINLIDQGKISADDVAAINLSLGLYTSTTAEKLGKTWQETHDDLMSSNMHQAIQKAVNEYDIPVIVAGGNGDGANPRTDETFPSDYDESISVTGTTKSTLADQQQYNFDIQWSDYNEAKDISAPGFGIWSLAPSTAKSRSETLQYGSTKNTMVQRMSGTSMASPIVAAACAIMRTEVPNATVAEIKQAMQETATKVDEYQGDPYYADRHNNGKSGSPGIINIPAAVEWLKENVAPEEPEPEPAKPNMAAAIMTVDKMSVAPGDTVEVTSTYTLNSSAAANITNIKNTLKLDSGSPTGITFQTGTLNVKVGGTAVSGATMASDGTITGIGNVAAGQSISVSYDVKIGDASSPDALDGKKLTISSSITADGLTGTTTASTSAISIKAPVIETPSLSMSVSSSSSSVEQGTDVPVTVTLRNANSKASVGSIKFTDAISGGATVKSGSVKVSLGGADITSACTVSASGSSLSITINGMDAGDTELTITYTLDTSAASGKVTNKPQFTVTGSTVSAGGQSSISVTVNEPEPEPEPGGNENENENKNEGGQQGGGNQNQNDNENENENQGGGTTNPGGDSGNENEGKPSSGNQNDNKNQGGGQGGGSTTGNDNKNSGGGSTTKPSGGSSTSNDNADANQNGSAQTPTSTVNRTFGDNGSSNNSSTSANGGGNVTDGNSNGGTTTLTSDVDGGGSDGGTLTDDGVSSDATDGGTYDSGAGTPVDTDDIVQTGAAPMIGAGIAGIGAGIAAVILSLRDRFKGRK